MLELEARRIHYDAGARMPRHADGCRRLSIVVGGELTETPDGDERPAERAGIGSVALKASSSVP